MVNPNKNKQLSPAERAAELVSQMTLEEKVNQIACRMVRGADFSIENISFENGIGQIALMGGKETPKEHAAMIRSLQEKVIKSSRLGIPAIIHCEALSGPVFPNATPLR
jgi:beta-glucosidase